MEIIAPATSADIPQLAELLRMLFSQEAEFSPDQEKQERALRLIIESTGVGVIFAASENGQIVGMVSLLLSVSTAEGGAVCWFEDLIIHPDRRGNGLGTRLLQHAIEYARTSGLLRITLLTDQVNLQAIQFYTKHNFVESKMIPLRLRLLSSR